MTCDKCGPAVKATNTFVLGNGELAFCDHCTAQYAAKLTQLEALKLPLLTGAAS